MDLPTFLVEALKAAAWPVATVTIGAMFKEPVSKLIGLVGKVKYKDLEIEIRDELQKEIDRLPVSAPATLPAPATAKNEDDELRALAGIAPRAAIMEAWVRIESQVAKSAAKIDQHSAGGVGRPARFTAFNLDKALALDPETRKLVATLRNVRNRVVHEVEYQPTSQAAEEYLQLAGFAREALRKFDEPA